MSHNRGISRLEEAGTLETLRVTLLGYVNVRRQVWTDSKE